MPYKIRIYMVAELLELKEAKIEVNKKFEMDEIKRDLALTNERMEKIKQRLGIN